MQSHPFEEDEREGAQSHTTIMHDFRTVQTTTTVGGGKQFANSKSHIRAENDDDYLHTTRRKSVTSRFAAKQADTDHAGGRERSFESVGAFDIAHTTCTPHTRQLHT